MDPGLMLKTLAKMIWLLLRENILALAVLNSMGYADRQS
jgi:hypothetical protein